MEVAPVIAEISAAFTSAGAACGRGVKTISGKGGGGCAGVVKVTNCERFSPLAGAGACTVSYTHLVQFGRTRGAHLFPADSLMSRAHMKISRRGDDFLVEDLGSRNGTFVRVNGRSSISPGSELIISGQLLRVVD